MNVHPATLSRVLNESRQLWAGSDEAPAVREIAYRLASAIAAEDPDFDQRAFVLGCGYEWPEDDLALQRALSSAESRARCENADMVVYRLPGDTSAFVQHASLALPEGATVLAEVAPPKMTDQEFRDTVRQMLADWKAAGPEQRDKAIREAAAGPPFTPAWEAMQECFRAEIERREPSVVGACSHARSVTTADGSGAYCASCGETLA